MAIYVAKLLPRQGGYDVQFPDLPGCRAVGTTIQECAEAAHEALAVYAAASESRGETLPAPTSIQDILATSPANTDGQITHIPVATPGDSVIPRELIELQEKASRGE